MKAAGSVPGTGLAGGCSAHVAPVAAAALPTSCASFSLQGALLVSTQKERAAGTSPTRVSPASPRGWLDPVEMPWVSALRPVGERVFGTFGSARHSPIGEGAEGALLPARLCPAASSCPSLRSSA